MLGISKKAKGVNVTNQEYHKAEGISSSDFRLLEESCLHLLHKKLFTLESKSLDLGSALHKYVLEVQEFDKEFCVEPEFNKRTNQGKEAYENWLALNFDKTILSESDMQKVSLMGDNILALAGGLLKQGVAEKSIFAKDTNGVIRKCRPDYYREDLGLVIDIKTSKDGSDFAFSKNLFEYNYFLQAAWYLDTMMLAGHQAKRFLFIIVDTSSPYMVRIREISPEAIELGREKYLALLQEYRHFLNTKECEVIKTIDLPSWVYTNKSA